jgi:Ala-tRNA(Pro) deacylase
MPTKLISHYLDRHRVSYDVIPHPAAYTAMEVAHAAHVPGAQLAKAVIIRADGSFVMVVLPGTEKLDLELFRKGIGAKCVAVAREDEFAWIFDDCETGAVPALGNLFGLTVYVADTFDDASEIAFCGGTHRELIRMTYRDFVRLVKPCEVMASTPLVAV